MTSTDAVFSHAGITAGTPRLLLRMEAVVLLAISVLAYRQLDGGWGLFAALFFVPDVSMAGYLAGPRMGAAFYNAGHSLLGPFSLAALAFLFGVSGPVLPIALIWSAHIGFDRLLGYGLKYPGSFLDTHLGRVGKNRSEGRPERMGGRTGRHAWS